MDNPSDAGINAIPSPALSRTWHHSHHQPRSASSFDNKPQDCSHPHLAASSASRFGSPKHSKPRPAPYFAPNLLARTNKSKAPRSALATATTALTTEHARPLFASAVSGAPSSSAPDQPSSSDADDDPLGSYVFPTPSVATTIHSQFGAVAARRDLPSSPNTLDSFGFVDAQKPTTHLRPASALPQTEANLKRHLNRAQQHRKSHSINTVPTLSPPSAADLSPPSSAASVDSHLQSPLEHVPRLIGVSDFSLSSPPVPQIQQHLLTDAQVSTTRIGSVTPHSVRARYGFRNLDGALGDVPAIRKISGMTDISSQSESSGDTIRASGEHSAVTHSSGHGHGHGASHHKSAHSARVEPVAWVGGGSGRVSKSELEERSGAVDESSKHSPSPTRASGLTTSLPSKGAEEGKAEDFPPHSDNHHLRSEDSTSPRPTVYNHATNRLSPTEPISSISNVSHAGSRRLQVETQSGEPPEWRASDGVTRQSGLQPHRSQSQESALLPDLSHSLVPVAFPDASSSNPPSYAPASESDGASRKRSHQNLASMSENRAPLFAQRSRSAEANKEKSTMINFMPVEETPELASLRDGPDGPDGRPGYPYVVLIRYAILGSQRGKLTLQELYEAIMDRFPWYRTAGKGWMNSVRHNLSLNKCFVREPRHILDPGKGSYWTVDLNAELSTSRARDRKRVSHKRKLSSLGAVDDSHEEAACLGGDDHANLSRDEASEDTSKSDLGPHAKKKKINNTMSRSDVYRFDDSDVMSSPSAGGPMIQGPPMTPESPSYAQFQHNMEGANMYPLAVRDVHGGSARLEHAGRAPTEVLRRTRASTINTTPYARPPSLSSPSMEGTPQMAHHALITPPSESIYHHRHGHGGSAETGMPYHPTSPHFAPFGYSRLPIEHHPGWQSSGSQQSHHMLLEVNGPGPLQLPKTPRSADPAAHSQPATYHGHHTLPPPPPPHFALQQHHSHRGGVDTNRYHHLQPLVYSQQQTSPPPFSPSFGMAPPIANANVVSGTGGGNTGRITGIGMYGGGGFPRMLSSPTTAVSGVTSGVSHSHPPTPSSVSHLPHIRTNMNGVLETPSVGGVRSALGSVIGHEPSTRELGHYTPHHHHHSHHHSNSPLTHMSHAQQHHHSNMMGTGHQHDREHRFSLMSSGGSSGGRSMIGAGSGADDEQGEATSSRLRQQNQMDHDDGRGGDSSGSSSGSSVSGSSSGSSSLSSPHRAGKGGDLQKLSGRQTQQQQHRQQHQGYVS